MTNENTTTADTPDPAPNRAPLGWFGLGAIIGAIVAVGTMTIVNAAQTPGRASQVAPANASSVVLVASTIPAPIGPQAVTTPGESIDPNAMALPDAKPFAPKVVARPENSVGSADAPVMIIEYSDFNCGYCRKFHTDTFDKVVDAYVKTGKVRLSYKHYPFLAQTSFIKAQASECAAEQDKFWEYHDALFGSSLDGIQDEASVRDALGRLAGDLKLDTTAFQACMASANAQARVQNDASEGQQLGVTGTPAFLINGKPLVGAQPFAAFQQAIDAALAEVQTNK